MRGRGRCREAELVRVNCGARCLYECEEGYGRASFGFFPDELHSRADIDHLKIAIDDVGEEGWTFVQRDVGDGEGAGGRAAHYGISVDSGFSACLAPLGTLAEAEGAEIAREIMRFIAGEA